MSFKYFPTSYFKMGIAAVLAGQSMVFSLAANMSDIDPMSRVYILIHGGLILSTIIVVFILGIDLFKNTYKAIMQGRITLESLFTISLLGAWVASLHSTFFTHGPIYYEVVNIVCFIYTIGKIINTYSKQKALEQAHALRISLDKAYVYDENGVRIHILATNIKLEDLVSVVPGELITMDGMIVKGEGFVTQTALTGEPMPVPLKVGDTVLAGTYSVDGHFVIRVKALVGSRKVDAIIQAVEKAQLSPSFLQKKANTIVSYFVPFVWVVCLFTFLYWATKGTFSEAIFNSMCVLLVACPCALGLSTPIAIWSGLWSLSGLGLVSKNGYIIDVLAKADTCVFDKTGTLTDENLKIKEWCVVPDCLFELDRLKGLITLIQQDYKHPLSAVFTNSYEPIKAYTIIETKIIPAKGIEAIIKNQKEELYAVSIGTLGLMPTDTHMVFNSILINSDEKYIYVSINHKATAIVRLEEKLRPQVQDTIKKIQMLGLATYVLTGDPKPGLPDIQGLTIYAGLTPEDKAKHVQKLKQQGRTILFVGDGLNDAWAISHCDASMALEHGSPLTQSAATGVLLGNTFIHLPDAILLSRRIYKKVVSNYYLSIAYNTIGMTLAAMGWLTPILAALLMLISSICVAYRAYMAAGLASKN